MKLYLDTCCFNRPLDDQTNLEVQLETIAKLNIQEQIRQGEYDLVWSYMLNLENSANPNIDKKISVQLWEEFAKEKCGPSVSILNEGIKIEK